MDIEDVFEKLNLFVFVENLVNIVHLERRPNENGIFVSVISSDDRAPTPYPDPSPTFNDDETKQEPIDPAFDEIDPNPPEPHQTDDHFPFRKDQDGDSAFDPAFDEIDPNSAEPLALQTDDYFLFRNDQDEPFRLEEVEFVDVVDAGENDSQQPASTKKDFADVFSDWKPKKNFICTHCPLVFDQQAKLKRHKNKVHQTEEPTAHQKAAEKDSVCTKCNKTFPNRQAIMKHWWKVHKTYSCSVCKEDFPDDNSAKRHEHAVHGKETNFKVGPDLFKCTMCPFTTSKRDSLIGHKRKVHVDRKFSCSYCGKLFKTKNSMDRHISHVHLNERPFECPLCKQKFPDDKDLRRHSLTKHVFPCDLCELKFITASKLDLHINQDHVGESGVVDDLAGNRTASCGKCALVFDNLSQYLDHYNKEHKGRKLGRVKCSSCKVKFNLVEDLRYHAKTAHALDCLSCESCSYVTTNALFLSRHEKSVHGAKVWICSMCEAGFTLSVRLDRHLRDVHGEKLLDCPMCGKSFSSVPEFKRHSTTRHKHHCSCCEMRFTAKPQLTTHEEQHTFAEFESHEEGES